MHALLLALSLSGMDLGGYPPLPSEAFAKERYEQTRDTVYEWLNLNQSLAKRRKELSDNLGGTAAFLFDSRVDSVETFYNQALHVELLWWNVWYAQQGVDVSIRNHHLDEARRLVGDDAAWFSGSWWR